MKTTYLVWKNPVSKVWQELTSAEFKALPDIKNRYFMRLNGADGDDAIIIESTKEDYLSWKKERNRRDYLSRVNSSFTTESYDAYGDEDDNCGEEILADNNADLEEKIFARLEPSLLQSALASLNDDEIMLIKYFYLSNERRTEQSYSDLTGIPQQTVSYRKTRILKKLKNFFES